MEGEINNQQKPKKKPSSQKKKHPQKKVAQQSKKQSVKLTRAQYDDLRQIEWVPFDPYAD